MWLDEKRDPEKKHQRDGSRNVLAWTQIASKVPATGTARVLIAVNRGYQARFFRCINCLQAVLRLLSIGS